MRFASAATLVQDLDRETIELCGQTEAILGDNRPDLVLAFFTPHFEDEADRIAGVFTRRYPTAVFAACSAEGVLGADAEHERVPAMALWLARMPGARLHALRAGTEDLSSPQAAHKWIGKLGPKPAEAPTFLLFADPFSVPINAVLQLFDVTYPQRPVLGGMVSGCEGPGQAVLILDDQVYREGAVGIAVSGVDVRTVVSQGCRPLGERFVITQCQRNVIQQLGGKPALQQLRDLLRGLAGEDLMLAQQSLFVGLVINEYKERFKRGDFVIRHLLAGDPQSGAIVVGDEVRVGMSMQFHVRDERSADEDLRELLVAARERGAPAGALLFTCNGRGTRMWSEPNHDVAVLRDICGPVPAAGFFAAGELGPIDGRNLIHGHTASIGLFYPRLE
ncbi:MAG: FIST C-terminal domain-containing protein [Planctomycetes bacterium]|nr:FIST C-terminal domain-containing protein [Planctomycetota bacterium]